MKIGIIGLPNVGKSTLFNILTNSNNAETANYPFCTIDPNYGIALIPDYRVDNLSKINKSKKSVYANIEVVDIAGLIKGASYGEGLGNKFLSNIRQVDIIIHVVRCFNEKNIVHINKEIDPQNDIDVINTELILSDISQIDNQLKKSRDTKEIESLNKILDYLNNNISLRLIEDLDQYKDIINKLGLLSAKPMIYLLNVDETVILNSQSNNYILNNIFNINKKEKSHIIVLSTKIESDLTNMSYKEKKDFLKTFNVDNLAIDELLTLSYKHLGLISFLTSGINETRAWSIKKGCVANEAAKKIHSDLKKGFIKAEIINYNEFLKYNSIVEAKKNGAIRLEGKNYIIEDGDIILFRFNI